MIFIIPPAKERAEEVLYVFSPVYLGVTTFIKNRQGSGRTHTILMIWIPFMKIKQQSLSSSLLVVLKGAFRK